MLKYYLTLTHLIHIQLQMYSLLYKWPNIKPVVAIELLYSIHADIEVRNFAVNCLDKNMKDEEVHQYLLQLVQV